jgi:hypothetical protein
LNRTAPIEARGNKNPNYCRCVGGQRQGQEDGDRVKDGLRF